jgi:CBS domain-containing protein
LIRGLVLLLLALATAPFGRAGARWSDARLPRMRRHLALAWQLVSVCLWGTLALWSGRSEHHGTGWDNSTVLLLLVAGFIWSEAWTLRGRARPGASRAADAPQRPELRSEVARTADAATAGPEPAEDPVSASLEAGGPEAEALLGRIQRLDQVRVDAIMIPRGRIMFADSMSLVYQALERMRTAGRGRLPVVSGGSLDRVLGIAHAKDLVPRLPEAGTRSLLHTPLRRWLRVPAGQPVAVLLETFRRDRVHIGIVTDTLGRTLGVVTLGDIFRHIAGSGSEGT